MWISLRLAHLKICYDYPMPPLDTPGETPRDPVHIADENAISIEQALGIAQQENVPLGKSTLQRWALAWKDQHSHSPVKSILWIVRGTKSYRLDREDFKAWIFEQKQNLRPNETLRGPDGPQETSPDPARPLETSRDSERSTHQSENETGVIRELRDELMQHKIDLEVRKQLLNQARDEIDKVRSHTEDLLRENGELQFQVRQLTAAKDYERLDGPQAPEPQHQPQ